MSEESNDFFAVDENNEKTSGPFETYREAREACGPNEAVFSERELDAVESREDSPVSRRLPEP